MTQNLQAAPSRPLSSALVVLMVLAVGSCSAQAQEQSIHERMFHSRAVEAVVWAMPLLNFKGYRENQIEQRERCQLFA